MLPEGEDINEWVAVNTVDFFNQVDTASDTGIPVSAQPDKPPILKTKTRFDYDSAK
jgi:MOB kinase activator 1